MSYLTEKQLAEIRAMRDKSFPAIQERKIRDLHEGRIWVSIPRVRAALDELAGEINRVREKP